MNNIHFDFKGDIYVQRDTVAMGSVLAPGLAGLFMVGLDRTIISISSDILSFWKLYVDGTTDLDRNGYYYHILSSVLFCINIKSSIDVLTLRSGENIETCV